MLNTFLMACAIVAGVFFIIWLGFFIYMHLYYDPYDGDDK
jgi:hypothetical protein